MELALVLPLLLIVLIGAVQFALVQHARTVTEAAAVEGARLAASEGYTLEEGALRTRAMLEAGLGSTGTAFIVTAERQGDAVVTHATGTYPLFIPWVTDLEIPIESSGEVWKEGFRSGP